MAEHAPAHPAPSTWEVDRAAFARALAEGRHAVGCSTRELARRARISQAYVVALEAGQRTPTIDVLARLAEAISAEPAHLLRRSLRQRARHVMLVVDHPHTAAMKAATRFARHEVDQWVWASSSGHTPAEVPHRIDLRRGTRRGYRPVDIARSLGRELQSIQLPSDTDRLGLVFADTSSVMCALPDPSVVTDFEHGWADVVDTAVTANGLTAAVNVCVYRLDDLRSLPESVDATLDIIRSHDTVWSAHGRRFASGDDAVQQVLRLVAPAA